MASHIDSEIRLRHLRTCLKSVEHQVALPRAMFVGISASEDRYADVRCLLGRVFENIEARGCEVQVRLSSVRLTQFQHYRALLPKMRGADGASSWVLFTDDDDLWHPRRVQTYAEGIQ